MRGAAFLLLLSLLTPTIAGVVCDVQCAHAESDGPASASAPGCHEQRPSPAGAALTAAHDDTCHAESAAVVGMVAERLLSHAAPAAARSLLAFSKSLQSPSLAGDAPHHRFTRPDILLTASQLRI